MANDAPSLLIASGVQGDPRRYRTFHLYEQAQLAGLNCRLSHVTDPGLRRKVTEASIIILHRAAFDAQIDWIEKDIHRRGGMLISDLDDLVFDSGAIQYIHSPDFADPVRRSLYIEDVRRFQKTLELSDYAIVSSDFLAERVRQLGKPASVHRNAFSLEMLSLAEHTLSLSAKDASRIVIGYASGTHTHDQDFRLILPALKSILERFSNVELWLVGCLDPGYYLLEFGKRIKKLDRVPWRDLPAIQAKFDINLAPLQVDNPFGQSKSEIKFMEAALIKVPTIASRSESYTFAICDGMDGYLANDSQDWQRDLEHLIENVETRSKIGDNAYQDVIQHYHPLVRARQLLETLNVITGNSFDFDHLGFDSLQDNINEHHWSSLEYEHNPTLLQRGLYTLRYRNLVTMLQQVWIYFRRLVQPIFPFSKPH